MKDFHLYHPSQMPGNLLFESVLLLLFFQRGAEYSFTIILDGYCMLRTGGRKVLMIYNNIYKIDRKGVNE